MDWTEIHNRKGFTPLTALLAPLSLFYGVLVRLRLKLYSETSCAVPNGHQLDLRHPPSPPFSKGGIGRVRKYFTARKKSLPGFVVSVGNLTVGGTGKTPAAIMIAEWALGQGYRVAVLSRGYGGKSRRDVLEVSDGNKVLTTAAEAGDEPYLMAKRLPGAPVIISRQRFLAGMLAHKKHATNFFILDDGFQHIGLRRDLDLVLIDSADPFGNGYLLPRGPLREPIDHLLRADAFLLTRAEIGGAGANASAIQPLRKRFPEKPILLSRHVPEKIVFPDRDEVYNVAFLKAKRVAAFAGIARPAAFRKTLMHLGAEVVSFTAFRDHHFFTPGELGFLVEEKERVGADCLVTTEKDWARLGNAARAYPDLAYLSIRLVIEEGAESFFGILKEGAEKSLPVSL